MTAKAHLTPTLQKALLDQARMVIKRLERLSVDSTWSHRASGYRGALVRQIDRFEALAPADRAGIRGQREAEKLETLIQVSFTILESAAREIPDDKKS